MIPQTGDIWEYISPYDDSYNAIVLIHKYMGQSRNMSNKVVLTFWGLDMITGQYDEWLFSEGSIEKCWRKVG